MGKIEQNKKIKMESLLNTAFTLFTSKGFQNTSISDIVKNAPMKGNKSIVINSPLMQKMPVLPKALFIFISQINTTSETN